MGVLRWISDFVMSPGFAGILAVVAAVVAYIAATKNAAKERWWKRAEFALNMTLSSDRYIRLAGLDLLSSMTTRDAGERTFIRVAVKWFLDAAAQQTPEADEPSTESVIAPGRSTRIGMRIDGLSPPGDDNRYQESRREVSEMAFGDIPQRQASGGPTKEEQVLAAQIRIELDRQDKIPTPTWIIQLANSGGAERVS